MNAIARDLHPAARPAARPTAAPDSAFGPEALAGMATGLLGGVPAPAAATLLARHAPPAAGGALGLAEVAWTAGAGCGPHHHADRDELLIVLSGEVELSLDGRVLRRPAGSAAFIPRGAPHALRALCPSRTVSVLSQSSLVAAA